MGEVTVRLPGTRAMNTVEARVQRILCGQRRGAGGMCAPLRDASGRQQIGQALPVDVGRGTPPNGFVFVKYEGSHEWAIVPRGQANSPAH